MRKLLISLVIYFSFLPFHLLTVNNSNPQNISSETKECIDCHSVYTPGIVEDWLTSRHAKISPEEALKLPALQRRISTNDIPDKFKKNVVGCYECHVLNPKSHSDNFDHFGYKINVIVSPNDCKVCHPKEVIEFSESKKAHAVKNLLNNPIYLSLINSTSGLINYEKGRITQNKASEKTLHETCLGCHGTKIEVKGFKTIDTKIGEILIPDLTNWPNQGVGRENPDGSLGSCTSCHPRHSFSIEIARKPYTCAQCHLDPDVPAWNVYKESKHGNIYFSKYHEWDFKNVPWTVGKDFKSPTCAVCHNSLIVSPDGEVIAERTHDFGSRLWVRLFGLIYSHAQPKHGNTTIIKNKDGLPLPVTLLGEPASEYLISESEQNKRIEAMKSICNSCHNTDWINGHFEKLNSTINETDKMTLTATKIILESWDKGFADKSNLFDEHLEKLWVKQWLFYSNSVRYASAMSGAPDYATFKNGWWELSDNINQMKELVEIKSSLKKAKR